MKPSYEEQMFDVPPPKGLKRVFVRRVLPWLALIAAVSTGIILAHTTTTTWQAMLVAPKLCPTQGC